MSVLILFQRLFLHHPLTKSHIEDNEPGCAKVTRCNTVKNKYTGGITKEYITSEMTSHIEQKFPGNDKLTLHNTVRNRLASRHSPLPQQLKSRTKKQTSRKVAFREKGTIINSGVDVDINFDLHKKQRPNVRSFAAVDPHATPFLDRFKKKAGVGR